MEVVEGALEVLTELRARNSEGQVALRSAASPVLGVPFL